jgi:hypothetical protein
MKYLAKASAPAGVWARAAAGMSGSAARLGVAVVAGEVVGVGVVGAGVVMVDEGLAVLEGDAPGLASPPHPASNTDAAASGTASRTAEVFFTAFQLTWVSNGGANQNTGRTTLGDAQITTERANPQHDSPR